MAMQLPFDILDYIFGLLRVSDRKTLISCSKVLELSPIIERHIYYHIIVEMGFGTTWTTDFNNPLTLRPKKLSKLVFENPHIVNHVRILQIHINSNAGDHDFANTLLMFPVLVCVILAAPDFDGWCLPDPIRAALGDRLSLPTIEGVHLAGEGIPMSLIDSKDIKTLSLSLYSLDYPLCSSTIPQPHTLQFLTKFMSASLLSWLKLHCRELRSFRTQSFRWADSSEILGVCSGTLVKLDVEATHFGTDFLKFPIALPNLEQLTIRTSADRVSAHHASRPQTVAKLVHLFHSTLRHLSIDINVVRDRDFTTPSPVDFSPFAFLGTVSRSIPRIDLYVHSDALPSQAIEYAQVLSSLEGYKDIARSIKKGVLVIHSEKTAPEIV